MPSQNPLTPRFQPLLAWRALQALMKDGEDTKQAFVITDVLRGKSVQRNYDRFRKSAVGHAVLTERRVLLERLCDRAALATLPTGTLGRCYHEFMTKENLTAEGLVEASLATYTDETPRDVRLFLDRARDTHDLSHVVTGYGRDGLGEISLLAFAYGQSGNFGLAFISFIVMEKVAREFPHLPIRATVWEGYRHGRAAAKFNDADWEPMLREPLDVVRARLGVKPPTRYQAIMAMAPQSTPMAEAA
jgi:ubiquinone biosynthesis protein COQ4